jgi:hypothetical protein
VRADAPSHSVSKPLGAIVTTHMNAPVVVGMMPDTICPRMVLVRGSWWLGSWVGSGYAGVPTCTPSMPGKRGGGSTRHNASDSLSIHWASNGCHEGANIPTSKPTAAGMLAEVYVSM